MSDHPNGKERRHFTRIPIDSIANMRCGAGQLQTRLLDISLKGALLERPDEYSGNNGDHCELELLLGEATITMQGSIVHGDTGHIGFRCDYIDLESVTHLKRLVELNLGDKAELEREFHELVALN
jgi:hypothetical protein